MHRHFLYLSLFFIVNFISLNSYSQRKKQELLDYQIGKKQESSVAGIKEKEASFSSSLNSMLGEVKKLKEKYDAETGALNDIKKKQEAIAKSVASINDPDFTKLSSESERLKQDINHYEQKCAEAGIAASPCTDFSFSENVRGYNKKLKELRADLETTEKKLAPYQQRLADNSKARALAQDRITEIDRELENMKEKYAIDEVNLRTERSEKIFDDADKSQEKIDRITSQIESLKLEKEQAQAQFASLQTEIGETKVSLAISDLKNKFRDVDDNLDAVEESLDRNSILSGYIFDKIGRTLNSDAICKSVGQCDLNQKVRKPNSDKVSQDEVLKQIFPKSELGNANPIHNPMKRQWGNK